ncbi:MAG: hypothetical protein WCK46_01520 [Candidatus Adlerbacteria bacterium]
MDVDPEVFDRAKDKAHSIYTVQKDLWCPYFGTKIVLNSDGFHHLQFSARRERNKREQLFKFRLLPLALEIVRKSGTVQEYRKLLSPVGKRSATGSMPMKEVEYWGLVAIAGEKRIKVRAVLRRIGNGNITFWSVMPYSKIKNGMQRMYAEGIEDE